MQTDRYIEENNPVEETLRVVINIIYRLIAIACSEAKQACD